MVAFRPTPVASLDGVTEATVNFLGYTIDHAPAPVMVLMPTLDSRDAWKAQKLNPLLQETPVIRDLERALARFFGTEDAAYLPSGYLSNLAGLQALAALKAPVDAFFDQVMVNADDAALRANRLALLAQLHAAMNRVADLSRLAT